MIETLEILKGQESYLKDKIDKLNRKAVKIGCPEMTLTFGDEIVYDKTDQYGRKFKTIKVPATLDYEIPIIDGWKLISTFDAYHTIPNKETGISEVIVTTSTVPGETVPITYADKNEIHCDHCGHNRFRTHSMLMQNVETGEYKEVGSTCIKDFFGHDPVAFMRWASWSFEGLVGELPEEEAGFGGRRGISALDLKETLVYASATIRKFGWMSKGKAYQQQCGSTADEVIEQLFPPTSMKEVDRITIEDRDYEVADEAIKHFIENPDLGNDYVNNCNKICRLGYVPWKHLGLTVSMVPSYNRAAYEKKEAAEDTSRFVGTIGDRLKGIEANVTFTKNIASDFGGTLLCIFKDVEGNTFKTFYSGTSWDCYAGDEVILTGTVKKHDEYKGKKATMLTRAIVQVTKKAEEAEAA